MPQEVVVNERKGTTLIAASAEEKPLEVLSGPGDGVFKELDGAMRTLK